MNVQTVSPIIPIALSIISIMVSVIFSIGTLVISAKNLKAANKKIDLEIQKWKTDDESNKSALRKEFLRDLFNGFTSHNWKFIEYWDFPGVFPPLDDMKNAIPDKSKENQELFGKRVVALEHLNILLRVFTHLDILEPADIQGWKHWANDWYEDSKQALRTILRSGDTYPLDFIIWLKHSIFNQEEEDFAKLFGRELKARLEIYEHPENTKDHNGG